MAVMEEKAIALYHRIRKQENFESAAENLFELLISTQKRWPNKPRILYVSIDGCRNAASGFDDDMFELQQGFGLGFLLQFFKEVHLPLATVKNTKAQNNDIPDELQILNAKNRKDDSLNSLYIENYSNTEFQSKEDVYAYLQKVSEFLKKYDSLDGYYAKPDNESGDSLDLLSVWHLHLKNLTIELFNSFVHGNLISVAAMTRAIIECYVYLSVIKKEQNARLLEDWFLCSLIVGSKKYAKDGKDRVLRSVEQYCQDKEIDYSEAYVRLRENENGWLSSIIKKKKGEELHLKMFATI